MTSEMMASCLNAPCELPIKRSKTGLYLVLSVGCTRSGRCFMAALASFDIVSKFDEQELKNALDQARREIQQRYDLKDTKTEIVLGESEITINTASETSLQAV